MSRPGLTGTLFVVALPFNFVYSYLVARGMFPVVPGLIGLLTYGMLVPLVALALSDTKIWRHGFILAAILMLAYALATAILYFFVFSVHNPDVDREIFGYHSINVIRSLTFLLIGINLTSYSRVGWNALLGAFFMALVVFVNTDVDSLSLAMPDDEELKGMYLFLGDTFAVVAIFALAYLRGSIVATLALCCSTLVLYLIGSRSSLYAFSPVACLYGLFLVRGIRLPFYRLVFLAFIATISVITLSALFVSSDASQNRMLVFVATGEDSSWAFRAWQLAEGLAVIVNNPLFGQYGSDYLLLNRNGDYIHSYLEIWRQFGILPFLLFLAALTGAARALWAARARAEEPAWRAAVLLMIFSGIEVAFSRTWGSPYIFAAIGMAANFVHIRRSTGPAPVIQPPAHAVTFKEAKAQS